MVEALLILGLIAVVVLYHALLYVWFRATVSLLTVGFHWALAHWATVVLWFVVYMLTGAAWSVGKWWFAETERVRKAKALHGDKFRNVKSNPTYFKEDIIAWIVFWPFVMTYTLLNDPIRRAARRLWAELQGIYQKITDHVWR